MSDRSQESGPNSEAFNAINWACTLPPILDERGTSDINLRLLALVMAKHADGPDGKKCFPALTTLQQMTTLSQTTLRKLLRRGIEAGLWVKLDKPSKFKTDWYELQLDADLEHHGDKVSDQVARRREKNAARQAAYRARQAEKLRDVTHQTAVTPSQDFERDVTQGTSVTLDDDGRDARIGRYVTQGSGVSHAATDRYVTQGSTVSNARSCGEPSLDLPRVDQPGHLPSLAPAARSRKEAKPPRRMNGVDQEALRLALDSMAEHSDYDWRPSWTTYLSGVERQGFHIQPQYVVEIQAIFAVILMEKDRLTLDACVERVLEAKAPYSTSAVATFAITRMFGKSLAPVSDEDIADWTTKQYTTLLAWTPKTTAPEVEVPLQRGSDIVSNGDEKTIPRNALAAMRERALGKPVAPKPKTAEDLEIEQRIREEEESNARWAAMSPAEREAQQAANRKLAGDLAREMKASQEKAIQEAEERGMAKLARRSADHARAWASMTVAS